MRHLIRLLLRRSAYISFIIFSLVSCNIVFADTIQDAIHNAIQTNPDIKNLVAQQAARAEDVRAAQGGYLPLVDVGAGVGKEYSDNPLTRDVIGKKSTYLT